MSCESGSKLITCEPTTQNPKLPTPKLDRTSPILQPLCFSVPAANLKIPIETSFVNSAEIP